MATSMSSPQMALSTKLLQALENPKYVWRTIDGLATDTGLSAAEVQQFLHQLPSDILVITAGPKGKLYSTRSHYSKKQSPWGKILSALSGEFK